LQLSVNMPCGMATKAPASLTASLHSVFFRLNSDSCIYDG
jgi:hypothetical protein